MVDRGVADTAGTVGATGAALRVKRLTGWIGDTGGRMWLTELAVSCLDPRGSTSASASRAGTSQVDGGAGRSSRRDGRVSGTTGCP